jgi:hypothetical protein
MLIVISRYIHSVISYLSLGLNEFSSDDWTNWDVPMDGLLFFML